MLAASVNLFMRREYDGGTQKPTDRKEILTTKTEPTGTSKSQ